MCRRGGKISGLINLGRIGPIIVGPITGPDQFMLPALLKKDMNVGRDYISSSILFCGEIYADDGSGPCLRWA